MHCHSNLGKPWGQTYPGLLGAADEDDRVSGWRDREMKLSHTATQQARLCIYHPDSVFPAL